MKLISWNVNGLRACLNKGFLESVQQLDPDILCLQESKLQAGQLDLKLPGYHDFWNYAVKKGYSGTVLLSRQAPLQVSYGLGLEEHDQEGRVICAEYEKFYLVTVYTPNAQDGLKRLSYRMSWEDAFRDYLLALASKKPLFVCGDLNVAHQEIDLENPSRNRKNPGFSDEEREKMSVLLQAGFVDTFRHFYPDKEKEYSWWSYRSAARERNVGWRIDYFLASTSAVPALVSAGIHQSIYGSDHCPVELVIDESKL